MCGIAGAIGTPAAAVSQAAPAILDQLAHRGPDGSGVARLDAGGRPITGDDGPPHVVLLHRRLAILDPTDAARQPCGPIRGGGTLSFNGEIYDYREHRRALPRDVRSELPSDGDTAVLAELLQARGSACLADLTGMFAISWVDAERGELLLARDRSGIKPLMYAIVPGGAAFASEVGPLLDVPGVSRRADPQRVFDFLAWNRNDGWPRTFFADIRQVPPGHVVRIPLDDPTALTIEPFAVDPAPKCPAERLTYRDAVDRTRATFLRSLDLHLRSDVPVGCALSGGIDSSAIAAGIRHLAGDGVEIHAFTHVAEDEAICEERWARMVADDASITMHAIRATPDDLMRDLPTLVRHQGEPFGSTSIYAQFGVFRAARAAGVPVMLDGQGADEMFAGYRHYTAGRVATALASGRMGRARSLLAEAAARGDDVRHLRRRAIWLAIRARGLGGVVTGLGIRRRPTDAAANLAWLVERGADPSGADTLGRPSRDVMRSMLHDARGHSSLPALLRFEDRNSMAHSVESRVPFLEPQLVELAGRLPEPHLLGDDLLSKRVLRDALRGIVPDPILERRDKIGFAAPEQRWLAGSLETVRSILTGDAARAIPFLDTAAAADFADASITNRRPFDQAVWRWISLAAWAEAYAVTWD